MRFPNNGIPGLENGSQGFLIHFRETRANLKKLGKRSCTYLGTLLHSDIPCAFSEFRCSIIIPFCQAVLISWTLYWSCLLAHKAGHFPLANQKWLWRILLLTPGGSARRIKSPGAAPVTFTGLRRTALLARQRERLLWFLLIHRSPSSPGSWYHGRASQSSGQTWYISFSFWFPIMS